MKASVILPARNEGKNIKYVIKSIKDSGKYEIIVVDDGSDDNTLDIAREEGCTCIRFSRNMGKGFACSAGAKIATTENLVFMDSDGQFEAADIPRMVKHLGKYDLVVGNRSMDELPLQRKISNSFATAVLSAAGGRKFRDVMCGFRAVKKNVFFGLKMTKKRYEFEVEMILKALRRKFTIKEIPVKVTYGTGSRMSMSESLKVAVYILGESARR